MKGILDISLRYAIMLVVSLLLPVFYLVLTPITAYPAYFLLGLFYETTISGSLITVINHPIAIVNSCTAGSAFLLLFILNFSTKGIQLKKRFLILLFDWAALWIFNILRIFFLAILLAANSSLFEFSHWLFWYSISLIFVFVLWIFTIKKFNIQEIPFVSDILSINHSLKKKAFKK